MNHAHEAADHVNVTSCLRQDLDRHLDALPQSDADLFHSLDAAASGDWMSDGIDCKTRRCVCMCAALCTHNLNILFDLGTTECDGLQCIVLSWAVRTNTSNHRLRSRSELIYCVFLSR